VSNYVKKSLNLQPFQAPKQKTSLKHKQQISAQKNHKNRASICDGCLELVMG
jgi:hypothetical protein